MRELHPIGPLKDSGLVILSVSDDSFSKKDKVRYRVLHECCGAEDDLSHEQIRRRVSRCKALDHKRTCKKCSRRRSAKPDVLQDYGVVPPLWIPTVAGLSVARSYRFQKASANAYTYFGLES